MKAEPAGRREMAECGLSSPTQGSAASAPTLSHAPAAPVAYAVPRSPASEELRRDFDLMADGGSTPMEYGLRVQSHPSLMVTSQVKMRAARNLMISFSGESVETVTFRIDLQTVNRNFQALQTLLSQLTSAEEDPIRQRNGSTEKWQGYVWSDVDSQAVIGFLSHYQTHTSAYRVNTQLLSEFITKMNDEGELKHWTIALHRQQGCPRAQDFG